MPAPIVITPEQVARWQHWYHADMASMRDIAARAGVAKNTVRKYLIGAGTKFDRGSHIAVKMRGRPSLRLGTKLSADQCAAIGRSKIGNKNCVGRVVSAETRQRMSDALRGRSRHAPGVAAAIERQRQKFKRVLKPLLRAAKIAKREGTVAALGYTRDALVAHITAQFVPGMSWERRESFSIDHIVPVVEFVRRGITDPRIVCSLANLRPLDPVENRKKSGKYDAVNFDRDFQRILDFNMRGEILTKNPHGGYMHGLRA